MPLDEIRKPIELLGVEWKQLPEEAGPGLVEITLTTSYHGFRAFEDLLRGVHRVSRLSQDGEMKISQPVVLKIQFQVGR